jgi:hypothetical protein
MARILFVISIALLVAGCAFHQPLTNEQVCVGGKMTKNPDGTLTCQGGRMKTYVAGKYRVGVLGDEITVIDRYDENGKLDSPSVTSTTGTVHDVLKAGAGGAGASALITPVVTPIVTDIEGKK